MAEAGNPAASAAEAVHVRLEQAAPLLKSAESRLSGSVSVHTFADRVALSSLFAFQKIAATERVGSCSFFGTVDGKLSMSVNPSYKPPPSSRKRAASDALGSDDAERAVERVRHAEGASRVSNASFELAAAAAAALLRVRAAGGATAVESWCISLRQSGQFGAAPSSDSRPSLVVAVRLAAGVAVPVAAVVHALRNFSDGMLTTDDVDVDFALPLSEQGKASRECGQKSVLLLASVPSKPDPASPSSVARVAPSPAAAPYKSAN